MPDDYSADTGTTGTVTVGGSATGEIETAGDRDWFAVTLEADKTYRLDLKGRDTGDGALRNPYLGGVYDADRAYVGGVDDDGGKGRNSRGYFTPDEDGLYFVAADATGGGTGTYTLSVVEVADDFAADTGTSGAVAVGGSVVGKIDWAGDRDWFAVTLEAEKTYVVDLKGRNTGDGTLRDPYLFGIHDADGARLAGTTDNNGGAGRNSRLTFTADEGGTYYVAAGARKKLEGTYTLSVSEVLEVGGSVTGKIKDDADRFAVRLEAGKTYRLDLKGRDTGDGTLPNPYLGGVYDAGRAYVGGIDDDGGTGRNSRSFFTPDEDGLYFVAAGATGGGTGTYTLSVVEVADDFAADTGTSGAVAVGGSATGEIEFARDRDWFAVTLEAGRSYRIDLKGKDTGDGTLRDPYLRGIHDAKGVEVPGTWNDDGGKGRNSREFFTPDEDGTYYVAASAVGDGTGSYTLSVADVTVTDDYSADTGTAAAVAVGGSATGEIEAARDADWFAVTLEAGRSYRIDLKGKDTGDGTLRDPYLHGIHDAKGVEVPGTWNDDGGKGRNGREFFTPDEDGTYYVAASAVGDGTGSYTLSVADVTVTDDYSADTGTAAAVAVGSSATGEIEAAGDRDWFAVTLEAGKTYVVDLKGRKTGDGTLRDPYLRGIHDADGAYIAGTWDDNDGMGRNSRTTFTPGETATYYVAAGAAGDDTGSYTLSVEDVI